LGGFEAGHAMPRGEAGGTICAGRAVKHVLKLRPDTWPETRLFVQLFACSPCTGQ